MNEPDRKLPEEVKRFLEQPRVAVLATVRSDGTRASTACWYELQDGRVLITMYATARRLPNSRSTPDVAMTILGEDPYSACLDLGPGDRDGGGPRGRGGGPPLDALHGRTVAGTGTMCQRARRDQAVAHLRRAV